jgi:hypothetical protein
MRKIEPPINYYDRYDPNLIVEETSLREPNLWTPGKKPVGKVKIDWTNSLTNGLEEISLCRSLEEKELVHNRSPNAINGTPDVEYDGINFSAASSEYINFDGTGIYASYPRTMFGLFYPVANTFLPVACHADSGSINNLWAIFNDATNAFRYFFRDSGAGTSDTFAIIGGSPVIGERNSIAGVSSASNDHKLYGNGRLIGTNTNSRNPAGAGMDHYTIGAFRDSTPTYGSGKVSLTMLFSVALTDSQVQSLHADPYQFLIPA